MKKKYCFIPLLAIFAVLGYAYADNSPNIIKDQIENLGYSPYAEPIIQKFQSGTDGLFDRLNLNNPILQISQQTEQSPYGPKETNHFLSLLHNYPPFMDCTDNQLIHFLVLDKKWNDSHSMADADRLDDQTRIYFFEQTKEQIGFHCAPNGQITPSDKETYDQLLQVALNGINNYRVSNNVDPLKLHSSTVAQKWAEQLLSEHCIHHLDAGGGDPSNRYIMALDLVGSELVSENLAFQSIQPGPAESIKQMNYRMMFDDASENWSHKMNILNPENTEVGIGIAYDIRVIVLVEDFMNPHGDSSGYLQDPSSQPKTCW